jgi:uncharacterized protein YbjT (DUF2867 family)
VAAKRILVTGGTGMLGGHIVPSLVSQGHDVRVLTRTKRAAQPGIDYVVGDLVQGVGVDEAVAGVDTILHLAGGPKDDDKGTQNLVDATVRAGGAQHIVYISVVGADKLPLGYFKAKAASERIVAESGVPHTTLRAAQCHEFVADLGEKMVKLPVLPVPSVIRFQPVAGAEVGARLVELTLGPPAGRVPDIAGPTTYPMADLVRSYLAALGKKRWIVPAPLPGKAGQAYRDGDNLTNGGAQIGRQTWEEFLAEKI